MINMGDSSAMSILAEKFGVYFVGLLSLVLAIFPIVYIYGEPFYDKVNTGIVGLNDLTARNIVFLCSVLFGINALVVVVLKFAVGSLGIKKQVFDIQQVYKTAMLAFKADFLRTTASILVVALFYLYFSDPLSHATGKNRRDHGWAVVIPAICALVYKLLSEKMHEKYVKEDDSLGSEEEKVSNSGAHVLIGGFAFIWALTQSGITNNGVKLDSDNMIAEGDAFYVLFTIGCYVLFSGIELAVEKIADKEGILYNSFVGIWQDLIGIRLSRIAVYIALPFLGSLLAHHPTQNNLIVVLSVLIAEGTQIGVVDFARKFEDGNIVTGLRAFQTVWSLVIGALGLITAIVDSLDEQVKVDAISPMNKTAEVFKEDKRLEASYELLYAVVVVASVIKLVDFVLGLAILKGKDRKEGPQRQKFTRFASLGLIVGSSYLWAGGATFWGLIDDNSGHKLDVRWAVALFSLALITRLADSAVLSVKDSLFDLWKSPESRDEDPLRKVSNDNIRTYLVLGALITALGFAARHRDTFPETKCDADAAGYVHANSILCVNQGLAIGLIALHFVVALVALLPTTWEKSRMFLLSSRPLVRIIVSTAVICLLVVTVGQTKIVSSGETIKAPDSHANNAVAALIAYLFADAFGDGFL